MFFHTSAESVQTKLGHIAKLCQQQTLGQPMKATRGRGTQNKAQYVGQGELKESTNDTSE